MNLAPDTFRIFVEDLQRARDFYVDIIGWRLVAEDEGWLCFETGSINVVVELVHAGHPEDTGLVGRFTGLSLTVTDIRAEFERLQKMGVAFMNTPTQRKWGGWLADFMDASGNTLTLVQRAAV